jgi:hypothetical protein
MLTQLLTFLQGKKTTIAAVIGYLVVFALGRGYIQQDVAELITGIMMAVGLSANVLTAKFVK